MSDDHVTLPDEEPDGDGEPLADPVDPAGDGGPAEPPVPRCHECGSPLEPGQPYCLECGAPTPDAPKLGRRIGPAGVLAIGLLALGIGAGALAYAVSSDDDQTAIGTTTGLTTVTDVPTLSTTTFGTSTDVTTTGPFPTQTLPPVTAPTTVTTVPPTPTTTPSTVTTVPPTTTSTPSTVTTPPSTGVDSWPDGTSGWTVILSSTTSNSEATAFRQRVANSGRSAGLIESSLYSTLEPDYWVVFSGQYTSRAAAISAAKSLRSTYPGAYAARIEES